MHWEKQETYIHYESVQSHFSSYSTEDNVQKPPNGTRFCRKIKFIPLCYSHAPVWGVLFLRGAKLCVVKSKRKGKQAETLTQDYIITREYLHTTHAHKCMQMNIHICTCCFVYIYVCTNRKAREVCVENSAALEGVRLHSLLLQAHLCSSSVCMCV